MDASKSPVLIIVGPTASGKTSLGVEIAKKYGGEIICADSRTVYEGMDIGTAKPTPGDMQGIPHWGLNLVKPNEPFNAAMFQSYARQKITEITARGRLPIVVGGTGLYVDALLFNYKFPKPIPDNLRKKLEQMTQQELYEYCVLHNYEIPENDKNKRHLIQKIVLGKSKSEMISKPQDNYFVVGIATNKATLHDKITTRITEMFDNGVVNEAKWLGETYGWNQESLTGNIYRVIYEGIVNHSSTNEIIERARTLDMQLAKRQMTWFRRNEYIKWCSLTESALYISHILATE